MRAPAPSPDRPADIVASIADSFAASRRSPVLGTPGEHGLDFEEVTFPASDGVPLEGWFLPAKNADTVVIVNHPRFFSRSGLPAHLEPWRSAFAATGNDIEVDLLPDLAILHEAGYHVLAYDLRNFGHSAGANGGVTSGGRFEARDVIGSLAYVRSRPDLAGTGIALFSRCLGANATIFGMQRTPEAFADVRCLVACQPLSPGRVVERALERAGLPSELIDDIDLQIRMRTGFGLVDMSPIAAASSIGIPTLVYQVRDDLMTRPEDVQAIFDAIPTGADGGPEVRKDLVWIEGTTRRWDGYLHFQRNPDRVLEWLERHG